MTMPCTPRLCQKTKNCQETKNQNNGNYFGKRFTETDSVYLFSYNIHRLKHKREVTWYEEILWKERKSLGKTAANHRAAARAAAQDEVYF